MQLTTEILLDLANRRYFAQRDEQVITHCETLLAEGRCPDCGRKNCDGLATCDLGETLSTGTLTVEEQIELLRPFR